MADRIEESSERLVIRKLIPATREEVFDAWGDAAGMRAWMCPGDVISAEAQIDFRMGGLYRIVMKSPKQDHDHTGKYLEHERPSRLRFTWNTKGVDTAETLVTVELKDRGGKTELTLTHERFPSAELLARYKGGWSRIADLLAEHFDERKSKSRARA
jgi:uncharacterized protein YndB with AHSA1/START domain